jgi:hypothetical protein
MDGHASAIPQRAGPEHLLRLSLDPHGVLTTPNPS